MGERGVSLWVGVIVISGIIVMGVVYVFLSRTAALRDTYTIDVIFKDAQEIQDGARVTMAGVDVGAVDGPPEPTEGHEASVRLRIKKDVVIGDNFRIFIAGGLLISEKTVKIVPAEPPYEALEPGSIIRGYDMPQVQDIIDQAASVVKKLDTTIGAVEKFITNEKLQQYIQDTIAQVNLASENFAAITQRLEQMTARNEGLVDQTIEEIVGASESLHGILEEVRSSIAEGISEEDLRKIQDSLARAAANIEEMTKTVKEKITDLVSDEEMHENLKATIANLRAASANAVDVSEEAKGIAKDAGATIREIRGTMENSKESLRKFREGVTTDFQITRATDVHRIRADASLYFPGGVDTYYRFGAFDIGESNSMIAQLGTRVGQSMGLRLGLYADKLSAGIDYLAPNGVPWLTLDYYDPNDPQANLRIWHPLTKDWNLVTGVDGMTKQNSFVLGLAYSPTTKGPRAMLSSGRGSGSTGEGK
jgi:ABC-type transporter Mla subunit MlaD